MVWIEIECTCVYIDTIALISLLIVIDVEL